MRPVKPVELTNKTKYKANGVVNEETRQADILTTLWGQGWFARPINASQANYGWPDVYAFHQVYKERWIEVKCDDDYSFTPAQRQMFPKLHAAGAGIWILTGNSQVEIAKLYGPPNWLNYIRSTDMFWAPAGDHTISHVLTAALKKRK